MLVNYHFWQAKRQEDLGLKNRENILPVNNGPNFFLMYQLGNVRIKMEHSYPFEMVMSIQNFYIIHQINHFRKYF